MFTGRIWRDSGFWLAEMALADVLVQGHSQEEAMSALKAALEELVNREGFSVTVDPVPGDDALLIRASDAQALLTFAFTRQWGKLGLETVKAPAREVEKLRQLLAWAMRLFEDAEIWASRTEVSDFHDQVCAVLGDKPWALPPHLIDHPDDETDDPDDDGEEK